MRIQSREYKLMLHPAIVGDADGVSAFWNQIRSVLPAEGRMGLTKVRKVCFLDSDVNLIRESGLVLRRRWNDESIQYTLKSRSEDRYIAETDWSRCKHKFKEKLEEDISYPFQNRYSHSCTIEFSHKKDPNPKTFKELAKLFPNFCKNDGAPLQRVNNVKVREEVYQGGRIVCEDQIIEAAVVLWKDHDDQVAVSEFSFKYEKPHKCRILAHWAKMWFEEIQKLDCCDPTGITKTQWAYSEPSWMESTILHAQSLPGSQIHLTFLSEK